MYDVQTRVKRGLAWLLANGYDLDPVDLSTLDMSHSERCVLGQATGQFFSEAMADVDTGEESERYWAVRHGLMADEGPGGERYDYPDTSREYEALTVAWTRAIQAHRSAVP